MEDRQNEATVQFLIEDWSQVDRGGGAPETSLEPEVGTPDAQVEAPWSFSAFKRANAETLGDGLAGAWFQIYEIGHLIYEVIASVSRQEDWHPEISGGPSDAWMVLSPLLGMSDEHRKLHIGSLSPAACEYWEDGQMRASEFRLDLARVLSVVGNNEAAMQLLRMILVPSCGEKVDETIVRLDELRVEAQREIRNIHAVLGHFSEAETWNAMLPERDAWPMGRRANLWKLQFGDGGQRFSTFFGRQD